MDAIAHKHKASPGQIALAWLLKRSPVMLPIPGTGKVAHLEENVGAAAIKLTDEEFATLDRVGRGATPACRESGASSFASAFIWATWSRRATAT